jgi:hypothetical protein
VRQEVAGLRDRTLRWRIAKADSEALQHAREAWFESVGDLPARFQRVERKVQRITERYRQALADLNEELADELGRYSLVLDRIRDESRRREADLEFDLPERPEPEPEPDAPWLYDSKRGYLEQLKAYKEQLKAIEELKRVAKAKGTASP